MSYKVEEKVINNKVNSVYFNFLHCDLKHGTSLVTTHTECRKGFNYKHRMFQMSTTGPIRVRETFDLKIQKIMTGFHTINKLYHTRIFVRLN